MIQNLSEKSFDTFHWLDIKSPREEQFVEIAEKFGLEAFPVKDSLEPGHLPKIEKLKDYSFLILRAYTADEDDNVATVEGLSNKIAFFFNEKQLITIHRNPFVFIDDALASKKPFGSVYELLIDLIREIIMTFEKPSQWQLEQIDAVEEKIFLKRHAKISLEDLYFQKAEARISKKLLLLTQNVVSQMEIPAPQLSAMEDVKDKLVKLILNFEEVLEDANNLMNTYLSVAAQKNNEVVKLLTIFSAFFLPLTFIVGIYGMNFDFMPELRWKFGYGYVMLLMLLVCVVIFIWFRRRKII